MSIIIPIIEINNKKKRFIVPPPKVISSSFVLPSFVLSVNETVSTDEILVSSQALIATTRTFTSLPGAKPCKSILLFFVVSFVSHDPPLSI